MVWTTDASTKCTFINKQWLLYTGSTVGESLGNGWVNYVHADDRAPSYEKFTIANSAQEAFSFIYRLYHRPTDNYRFCQVTASPRFSPKGKFMGYNGCTVDIHEIESKFEEVSSIAQELERKSVMLETLSNIQQRFITRKAPRETFEYMLTQLLSLTESEYGFIGEVLHRDNGDPYLKTHAITNIAWSEETREFFEKNAPNGLEFSNMKTLFGVVITSEEAVISNDPANDPRSGGLPHGHPDMNCFMGLPFKYDDVTVGMVGIANRPKGYTEDDAEDLSPFLATCASLIHAYRLNRNTNKIQEELQFTKERFELATESSNIGVWDYSPSIDELIWSHAMYDLYGVKKEDFRGIYADWRDRIHPEDLELAEAEAARSIEYSVPFDTEFRVIRDDGEVRWIRAHGHQVKNSSDQERMIGTNWDITDEKMAEEAQQQMARLESVGQLAGGIAHDFNNFLGTIMLSLSMAEMDEGISETTKKSIASALNASRAAQMVTKQLLTFSRGGKPVRTVENVGDIIRETVELSIRGTAVEHSIHVEHELPPAKVDHGQIQAVINNIILNARQAMGEKGSICISAGSLIIEEGSDFSVKPGPYVCICIEDNGPGIPAEFLNKVFDPYFTTKEHGSGLGLASAYSIIVNHEGAIQVISEPGSTVFKILLPAISSEKNPQKNPQKNPPSNVEHGKAHILVMDDNEELREVLEYGLKKVGYQVSASHDGEEALKLFNQALESGRPVDLAILDITVPGGMGGEDTLNALRKINPNITAVAISGYSQGTSLANFKSLGFSEVLAKPFPMSEVTQLLKRLLHEEGEVSASV